MILAVLSGKGGAGKTFVSSNLSLALKNGVSKLEKGKSVSYCDCDVEEPNGFLFFPEKENETEKSVNIKVPVFDLEKCVSCGKCADVCAFNAIAFIRKRPKLMGGICHSCGGCVLACGEGAISEGEREIGKVKTAFSNGINIIEGRLNVGEASGIKIIEEVIQEGKTSDITVIDCPPGSACSAMECVKVADACVIVGEPTNYGIHDLKMVSKLTDIFKKPTYFVINKAMEEDNQLYNLLLEEGKNVLLQIPFSKETAKRTSEGTLSYGKDENLTLAFDKIASKILSEVRKWKNFSSSVEKVEQEKPQQPQVSSAFQTAKAMATAMSMHQTFT